jgi:hypothetical protein
MKDITDTNYYKIDTDAFEYSPHAPVSDEQVKRSKKFWTSKSEEEYYTTGFGIGVETTLTEIYRKLP